MNIEPTAKLQSKFLELKRFLNRVSDISLSYRELKDKIYKEQLPIEFQISEYQKLVDETMSLLITNQHDNYSK